MEEKSKPESTRTALPLYFLCMFRTRNCNSPGLPEFIWRFCSIYGKNRFFWQHGKLKCKSLHENKKKANDQNEMPSSARVHQVKTASFECNKRSTHPNTRTWGLLKRFPQSLWIEILGGNWAGERALRTFTNFVCALFVKQYTHTHTHRHEKTFVCGLMLMAMTMRRAFAMPDKLQAPNVISLLVFFGCRSNFSDSMEE